MKLWRSGDNKPLIENLTEAKSLNSRLVGLLSHKSLNENEGMLIYKTNSVHTFFMRFSIDVVFLDKDQNVVSVINHLKPWRITLPRFRAKNVLELKSGVIQKKNICIGDRLNVGS
jgi:uncharacterized protein